MRVAVRNPTLWMNMIDMYTVDGTWVLFTLLCAVRARTMPRLRVNHLFFSQYYRMRNCVPDPTADPSPRNNDMAAMYFPLCCSEA
jgi:hypothetical protein